MKRVLVCTIALAVCACAAFAQEGWQLVWSDEFNGTAGTKPDPSKWGYDKGANGWGNQEWENYTDAAENASMDGSGNLIIKAIKTGANQLGGYTSARLLTKGKFTTTYGRIEARIRIPYGQGIWPAFWMLGANIDSVSWPTCGEIDIMENIGKEPNIVHATVHGPGYSGGQGIGKPYTKTGARFADEFHVYTVIWLKGATAAEDSMEFLVDGNSYHKVTPASLPAGQKWVFDKPFFILLNLAVGGSWPGYPNDSTEFPQTMTVDYVRVYKLTSGPAIHAGGIVNGASFQSAAAPGSLASIFGVGLAGETRDSLFDTAAGAFPTSASGVSVKVNGELAPLTYISPAQINFQVPWQSSTGGTAPVQVQRGGALSDVEPVRLSVTAPSAFAANGVAILNCDGGTVKPGVQCVLWGNGFGPLQQSQNNGVPSPGASLTRDLCRLTVGGVEASVSYCGAAPTLVIDQLNFGYPAGVSASGGAATARLTIGDQTGEFTVPAPVD